MILKTERLRLRPIARMIANHELNLAENQCTVLLFYNYSAFEGKITLLHRQ